MNIIQELAIKYSGKYSEELPITMYSSMGKLFYQPKNGIFEIDGSKIRINLKEVGGADPVTEPFLITLYLGKTYETELSIFPKTLWNNFLDLIRPKFKGHIPKQLRNQFSFVGNRALIKELTSDQVFAENIKNERVYIRMGNEPINRIILTPEYGIRDIDQFESFVLVLKRIEIKIKAINEG